MKTSLLWIGIAQLAIVGLANAETKATASASRVLPPVETILSVANRVGDDDGQTASPTRAAKAQDPAQGDRAVPIRQFPLLIHFGLRNLIELVLLTEGEDDIAEYDEAIRLNPNDASAYFNRGYAWSERVRSQKAVTRRGSAVKLFHQAEGE